MPFALLKEALQLLYTLKYLSWCLKDWDSPQKKSLQLSRWQPAAWQFLLSETRLKHRKGKVVFCFGFCFFPPRGMGTLFFARKSQSVISLMSSLEKWFRDCKVRDSPLQQMLVTRFDGMSLPRNCVVCFHECGQSFPQSPKSGDDT